MPKKFPKHYIKNFLDGSLWNHQTGTPGPLPATQEGGWRGPTLGRAGHPPGYPRCPPDAPLRLYNPLGVETPKRELFFAETSLFRRHRRFLDQSCWRSCSGTLPEGDHPSGRPSIAMDASRMCRE